MPADNERVAPSISLDDLVELAETSTSDLERFGIAGLPEALEGFGINNPEQVEGIVKAVAQTVFKKIALEVHPDRAGLDDQEARDRFELAQRTLRRINDDPSGAMRQHELFGTSTRTQPKLSPVYQLERKVKSMRRQKGELLYSTHYDQVFDAGSNTIILEVDTFGAENLKALMLQLDEEHENPILASHNDTEVLINFQHEAVLERHGDELVVADIRLELLYENGFIRVSSDDTEHTQYKIWDITKLRAFASELQNPSQDNQRGPRAIIRDMQHYIAEIQHDYMRKYTDELSPDSALFTLFESMHPDVLTLVDETLGSLEKRQQLSNMQDIIALVGEEYHEAYDQLREDFGMPEINSLESWLPEYSIIAAEGNDDMTVDELRTRIAGYRTIKTRLLPLEAALRQLDELETAGVDADVAASITQLIEQFEHDYLAQELPGMKAVVNQLSERYLGVLKSHMKLYLQRALREGRVIGTCSTLYGGIDPVESALQLESAPKSIDPLTVVDVAIEDGFPTIDEVIGRVPAYLAHNDNDPKFTPTTSLLLAIKRQAKDGSEQFLVGSIGHYYTP